MSSYRSKSDKIKKSSFSKLVFFLILFLAYVFCLVRLATYDAGATETEVSEARTDGPIYDLPAQFKQQVVVDRDNKEYILIWCENKRGAVTSLCVEPLLDSNGSQKIADQI